MRFPIILIDGKYDITYHKELNIRLELQDIEDDYIVAYDSDGHRLDWDIHGRFEVTVKMPDVPADRSAELRANLIDYLTKYKNKAEADLHGLALASIIAEVGKYVPWY